MGWEAKFNTDYWDEIGFTWTGSSWTYTGSFGIALYVKGSWADSYRPEQVRITFSFAGEPLNIKIPDRNGPPNFITNVADISSLQELGMSFVDGTTSASIYKLTFEWGFNSRTLEITNIEFGGGDTEATNLLDGKIRIKNNATNLLDGKAEIDVFAVNTFDGKVKVKDSVTNLFNGKAEVIGWLADLLDGKAEVTGWAANLLDGKLATANLSTVLFNGKLKVCTETANLLDGKVKLYGEVVNVFDGKATVLHSSTINLLDGKVKVSDKATNLFDGKCVIGSLAHIDAAPPVPTASFGIGKIISGESPIPGFTCTANIGRYPSLVANAPCPVCSMRVGLSLSDIATISRKAGVPVPTCQIVAVSHHLATIFGNTPCPVITCAANTENIAILTAPTPCPRGLFEITVGNVADILGRVPCPTCSVVAITGQIITLAGNVPLPGPLVRFYASPMNVNIILEGNVPVPMMTSSVLCSLPSSILRHIRGEVR